MKNLYYNIVSKSWFSPIKIQPFIVFLIIVSGFVAAGMNGYLRYWQYEKWEENSEIFYLDDGTPLFTTTDAPYFLGLAKAIKQDGDYNSYNYLRSYSHEKKFSEVEKKPSNIREAPLLSVILSMMASDSSVKSLLEAGHLLVLVSAILTALMVVFAFGAAGYWLEGAVAAAGGGLSLAFLPRSGAGRIDTDQLNLGFFYLMTGLVVFAAREKNFRIAIVLAAFAGVVYWVFDWWYSKPFFGWAFFIGFVWLSIVCRSNLKQALLQSALFLLLSGLPFKELGISSDSGYLNDVLLFKGLIFPNTFDTITEIKEVPFSEILIRISGSLWLGIFSLFGLVFWAIRHPAYAIVFGPAASFALLNYVIGNRAIFYSAPMLWFGFGWLIITFFRWIDCRISRSNLTPGLLILGLIISFVSVWVASPTNYLQGPSFDKKTVSNFQMLQKILPEDNVAIASWWDYGYMSMLFNERPTLHDGGAHRTPSTHLIARNLLQSSQKIAAQEFQLLSDVGYGGVLKSRQKVLEDNNSQQLQNKNTTVYLVLTSDMVNWMPSISKIGAFDIKLGKPFKFDGAGPNYQLRYNKVTCQPINSQNRFLCNDLELDLNTGKFGNNIILYGASASKDGKQTGARKFQRPNSPFIIHSELGNAAPSSMIIHRDLYFSVFHQLFYLNKAIPDYFTLIYDGFPDMKVFKIF